MAAFDGSYLEENDARLQGTERTSLGVGGTLRIMT